MCLRLFEFSQQTTMKKTALVLALLMIFSIPNIMGQGKLEKAEKSISKKERRESRGSRSQSTTVDYDDYQGSFIEETFAALFVDVVLFGSYYAMIETPIEREYSASMASITKYPYLDGNKGNYAYQQGEDTQGFRTTLSSRFVAENSKLYGNHLNLNMRFLQRVGVEIDYLQLWEENTNFGRNALALYTALAKYHRVRTQRFDAWWGLGATYIDGAIDEWGFTYGVGIEWFFAKPFSLESNFNQTFINDETINKFNGLVNYHIERYKLSGGMEHLKIGNIDFTMFSAGLGIAF